MSGRIPQSFIDEVLNQTDIVELVNGYVELKAKGKEHVACCPFHHEKTPSFTVSATKQFYHCFGCGAHGTAVGFLMEKEGLSFIEAIELLAHRLGKELPKSSASEFVDNQGHALYAALNTAGEQYYRQLCTHEIAQNYLKSRGITGQIAKEFLLGFAPDRFDFLTSGTAVEFGVTTLVENGLLSKNDQGRTYDRFRNRLMFPIRDYRGRIIGFGGRVLDDSLPKYMNSPETPVFHKNRTLYGLYEARKALGRVNQILIVEGYMDVVNLAQHGVRNVVATLGTATTREHIQMLARIASEFIFCFDGDEAGRKAAWRAVTQILPSFRDGMDVRFLFLPEGEDPDSYVRVHGADKFLDAVKDAIPLTDYFFSELTMGLTMDDPASCAKLATKARPLIEQIPPGVFKSLIYKELESRIGIRVKSPENATPSVTSTSRNSPARQQPRITKVRMAIALLLRSPSLSTLALPIEELELLSDRSGISLFVQMLQILEEQPTLTTPSLLQRFQDTEWFEHLQKLLSWDNPDMENENREISFRDVMESFRKEISKLKSFDNLINAGNQEPDSHSK